MLALNTLSTEQSATVEEGRRGESLMKRRIQMIRNSLNVLKCQNTYENKTIDLCAIPASDFRRGS